VTQNVIDLWTNYGFGVNISVTIDNEVYQKIWDEFWKADRNMPVLGTRNIYVMSQEVLVGGELFLLCFINRYSGEVTLRYLETEEITDVITSKTDRNVNLFYVRENFTDQDGIPQNQTVWYPDALASKKELDDYELPSGVLRADKENAVTLDGGMEAGTDVRVIHIAHRKKGKSRRGWPLMTAGLAWSRAYRNFLQDRASVSRAVAAYVDKVTLKGGSRAIDAMVANLQSSLATTGTVGYETNPAAVAGSSWVQNQQVDRERMPLTTGAGDAEKDGAPLLAQAALSGGVYNHWVGRGETYRLATATSMEGPVLKNFNGYQLFWSSVWKDLVRVIINAMTKDNPQEYNAQVNLDPVIAVDLTEIKDTGTMLNEFVDRMVIGQAEAQEAAKQLISVSLNKLGVDAAKVFEVAEPPAQEAGANTAAPFASPK